MSKIISISVNDEDLRRVDDFCHAHNLTRSTFVWQSAIEKIAVSDLVDSMSVISNVLSKYQDKSCIDQKDLDEIRLALKMIKGE